MKNQKTFVKYAFAFLFLLIALAGMAQLPGDTTQLIPPPMQEVESGDEPFTFVEVMPIFPGGQQEMYKFIYTCLDPDTTTSGLSGNVITQFVITADGMLEKIRTLRSPDPILTTAVEKCLAAMPKWSPGLHKGKPVPVMFTLPVKFVAN